ncbi:major facilitator superfamily domain-containing protein [Trichoderma barbatum]
MKDSLGRVTERPARQQDENPKGTELVPPPPHLIELFIYPVKSLLPIEVSIAEITSEGFRFDRQYILVRDPRSHPTIRPHLAEHITVKRVPKLVLFQPSINDDWSELTIKHTIAKPESSITIPLTPSPLSCLDAPSYQVSVFGTEASAVDMGDGPAEFFSKHLDIPTRLLFISGSGSREIPGAAYIPKHRLPLTIKAAGDHFQPQRIRFADAAPFLVSSTASEENVRSRLPQIDQQEDVLLRFRPNIHVDVGSATAWDEDYWRELTVFSKDNKTTPKAIIRCVFKTPRCLSVNADIKTGTISPRSRQVYGLIARDRRVNKAYPLKPVFGQWSFAGPNGALLRVGDEIRVTERGPNDNLNEHILTSDDEATDCVGTPISEETVENTVVQEQPRADEHDGGYGWVCVVCQLMITASTWGVNGAFGVYLTHYISTNAFPGTSEIAYSFIGGLSQSQILIIAPIVTHATRVFGTKPPLLVGAAMEAAALIGASFATQSWHLFLSQGLLFGWGCSFLYIGTIGIIPQWFAQRKGIANGIAAAGSGIGGLIYSLSTEAMISNISVAWAFRITAICTAAVNVICIILIKDRNKHIQPTQNAFDFRLFRRAELLLISTWMFLSIIGYTCVLFSLPDNAVRIGLTAHQGSILGALANLGMAIGRPIVGYFSDRVGRLNMVISATIIAGIWCLCLWTSGTSYSVLLAFSIIGGTTIGTCWAVSSRLCSISRRNKTNTKPHRCLWVFATCTLVYLAMALGLRRTQAPIYLDVQIFSGCMFIGAALFLVPLRFKTRIESIILSEKQ